MRSLRSTIIANLLFLTLFFNIERIDFGQDNLIDISSIVYGLVIAAMLSVLFIPWLGRRPVILSVSVWTVIFGAVKLFLSGSRPALGGIYTYLTLTELLFLVIGVILAHRLAQSLHDFEDAVENITMAGVGRRVKKLEAATEEIQLELARSRRFKRNLVVMVVEPDPKTINAQIHRAVREVQQTMMARYLTAGLARKISAIARRSDLIIDQHDEGRLVIFSPETNVNEAQELIGRIRTAAGELGTDLNIGIAAFPEQALTFEELVSQAECQTSLTPEIVNPMPNNAPAKVGEPL